jgi:hypothetical protein
MERRNLMVGLLVLAASLLMVGGGTAFAGPPKAKKGCIVHSLPSFVAQGEGVAESSVADIIEVECEGGYEGAEIIVTSQELYSRCGGKLYWSKIAQVGEPGEGTWTPPTAGEKVRTKLDNDDNATVVVWGGPGCATGQSIVSAHFTTAPSETFMTNFTVLTPNSTPLGLKALDVAKNGAKVEDATFSDVVTIAQLEFETRYAEKEAVLNAEQLYFDCPYPGSPGVVAYGPVGPAGPIAITGPGEGLFKLPAFSPQTLNNNGNAFVVLLASRSCTPATLSLEASVSAAPKFVSYVAPFKVETNRPTF